MKRKTIPLLAALLGPVILQPLLVKADPVKEDLTAVYEAGRRAFNKGDLATAKTAFSKVLRAKPDFDLAQIYMAQIRHAEAQWEARPRSQKIAEKAQVASVAFHDVALSDALEVVRREVEKAGAGPTAGPIELMTDLSAEALAQPISLSVEKIPMQDFIEMVAFAGGVKIAWHPGGLSVTTGTTTETALDPARASAQKKMKESAQAQVIPSLHFEGTSLADSLAWLQAKADPSRGPRLLLRSPANPTKINLNLRNTSIPDALRSLAIIADLEVTWHPWGAGLAPKPALAASDSAPKDP